MPTILKRSDYEDFLILLYFGPEEDRLRACARRAYRDFNRTLRGIKRHPQAYERGEQALARMFSSIRQKRPTQAAFDAWHRRACAKLISIYREEGYRSFFVGHAQKWLNMTFKYIYVLGEERLGGFRDLYDLCHVPLDKKFIDELRPYGFQRLPCAWSRLDDYDIYINRQRWIRRRFPALAPQDAEFQLWMGRDPSASSQPL